MKDRLRVFKNFLTLEGIDYSGKTTQHHLLKEQFARIHKTVHLLREPGGTVISEKIRDILLNRSHQEMHPRTEILLYSAARAQIVHQTLQPLLTAGERVILDRFFDSTTVYQGYGRGLDIPFVNALNRFATSGLMPYKTLLIDISPEEAIRRRRLSGRSGDRLDNESLNFYQTIHQAYQQLVQKNPDRFIVIPGELPVAEVAALIWKKIKEVWDL